MSTFIKWTGTDEEGTFSHVGKLIKKGDGYIKMQLLTGGMVELDNDDGSFVEIEKPVEWDIKVKQEAADELRAQIKVQKEKVQRPVQQKAGTKKEQAAAIYREANGDKTTVLRRFIDELSMTSAGAMTYFYNCRKSA